MYHPDLGNNCYGVTGARLRTVGWLTVSHPYSTGAASKRIVDKLARLIQTAWDPFQFYGGHSCDLCTSSGPGGWGWKTLCVPSPECVYVVPELILHYIEKHRYKPPDEFIQAVELCPDGNSAEYGELLKPYKSYWNI